MKKHFNIHVSGLVQGGFFRKNTVSRATSLGLHGFVMNLNDGSVYIEAEGNANALEDLVNWCQEGPSQSKVENVTFEEGTLVGMNGFIVKS